MKDIKINCRDYALTISIQLPNTCPHCGERMTPDICGNGVSDNSTGDNFIHFGMLARCTDSNCKKYYSLEYYYSSKNGKTYLKTYEYRPPIKIDLPENIDEVSSHFVEIFTQATKAEEEGLDQIAGVGYRKSLEFLIKDYVIFLNPEKEDQVKNSFLGKVIENHLTHIPRLQSLAKAASWIGNDETHYVRRHDDKDIRDMKQFIKSTAHFVVADYDAHLAEQFISQDD